MYLHVVSIEGGNQISAFNVTDYTEQLKFA